MEANKTELNERMNKMDANMESKTTEISKKMDLILEFLNRDV